MGDRPLPRPPLARRTLRAIRLLVQQAIVFVGRLRNHPVQHGTGRRYRKREIGASPRTGIAHLRPIGFLLSSAPEVRSSTVREHYTSLILEHHITLIKRVSRRLGYNSRAITSLL